LRHGGIANIFMQYKDMSSSSYAVPTII